MIIREIKPNEKIQFNSLSTHPLQSWEWGEFRMSSGVEVIRLGRFEKDKLVETAQFTIHPIPFLPLTIGYFPKGGIPGKEMLSELYNIGKQCNCIFIKLEPNIRKDTKIPGYEDIKRSNKYSPNILVSQYPNIRISPHPLFTKYTWELDLTESEETILNNMHPKTRYNIRVAKKHNVVIKEDNSPQAFENYLKLTFETAKRQKFFAHTPLYHRQMWETMHKSGIAHLFTANYNNHGQNLTLASFIVFLFNDVLYYPYGSSSSQFRNLMASNLLMWEVIRWGKKNKAEKFDMWGALGPNSDTHDPWFGFNRFKEGYGPKIVEFTGSFDLVIHPNFYKLYNLSYNLRQVILKIKRVLI